MLKNHLTIAFRALFRHRSFSFINIMGLAVGMATCFLIYLYVQFENSYDVFHTKADRIYRLGCDIRNASGTRPVFTTTWPMGPAMQKEFPEVASVARVVIGNFLVQKGNIKIEEDRFGQADSTLFSIFDIPLLEGNPHTALKEPGSMVISASTARKYFGSADPIGQTLILETGRWTATITGIMKDMPENTQLKADMFFSTSTFDLVSIRDDHQQVFPV